MQSVGMETTVLTVLQKMVLRQTLQAACASKALGKQEPDCYTELVFLLG